MILVHIGLAKSASSTIQNLIKYQENINFLGLVRDHEKSFSEKAANEHEYFYSYIRGVKKNYNKAYQIRKHLIKGKINFFSDEAITLPVTSNVKDKLTRLHKILPESKIILIIRNPVDTIISWHNFHIRGNVPLKNLNIKSFLDDAAFKHVSDSVNLVEKIECLKKKFGKKNILLVDFNSLTTLKGQKQFLKKIFKIDNPKIKGELHINYSFSLLNQLYSKFPYIYRLKFMLPVSIIKNLKKILGFLFLKNLEYKFKEKANKEKIEYLNLRYKNEVNEYFQIKKEFNL